MNWPDIAAAMMAALRFQDVTEDPTSFIRLDLTHELKPQYLLGAWGLACSAIDGSPANARARWHDSNMNDSALYVVRKFEVRDDLVMRVILLHREHKIEELARIPVEQLLTA